jgi:UDP-N-acetylglucosamine acyltransferase
VGLKRRGFSEPSIRALRESYRLVYRSSLRLVEAIERIRAEVEDLPEVRQLVSFLENSQRGICR